jgi:hypothetical protein
MVDDCREILFSEDGAAAGQEPAGASPAGMLGGQAAIGFLLSSAKLY